MKKRKGNGLFSKVCPSWAKELVAFVVKITVEVTKDKLARAVVIGVVSSAGSLFYTSGDGEVQKDVGRAVQEVRHGIPLKAE